MPRQAVLVTFDDGYESFYTDAYPVLTKLGIPAVNFVITHDLEDHEPGYLPHLTAAEIGEMHLNPIPYDFQCHTDQLHRLVGTNADLLSAHLTKNGAKETDDAYRQRVGSDTAPR